MAKLKIKKSLDFKTFKKMGNYILIFHSYSPLNDTQKLVIFVLQKYYLNPLKKDHKIGK